MPEFVNPNLPSLARLFESLPIVGPGGAGTAAGEMPFSSPNLDPMMGAPAPEAPLPSTPFLGAPMAMPAGAPMGGVAGGAPAPEPTESTSDKILRFLVQAMPGIALGAAAGRYGATGLGQVAGGMVHGLQAQSEMDFRSKSLGLREREIEATEGTRAEAARMRVDAAITAILDRARDDAANFEGSPEEFSQWREQIANSLAQYGAEDRAREIRFPNARFLGKIADEDRKWWDLVVRDHGDKLFDPEQFESLKQLTQYSAIRGRSRTLEEALRTIGLADEEGDLLEMRRSFDPQMLPAGAGQKVFAEPELGKVYSDPSAADRPRMGATQTFENPATGEVEVVITLEDGTTKRIRVPATEGFRRVGGSNLLEILKAFGLGPAAGDADPNLPADEDPVLKYLNP